jgi:predicted transcriptional regulator
MTSTTVTVLNRLALEGAISKRARGLFCYDQEVKLSELGDTEEKKIQSLKIDKKTAATIYKAIYNMASESAGSEVIGTVTGLSLSDFDENAPVESIQKLVRALNDVLGQEMARDIVNIALENELTSEKITELIQVLT